MQSHKQKPLLKLTLLFVAVAAWSSVALGQDAKKPAVDFNQALQKAQALYDKGAFAEAHNALDALVKSGSLNKDQSAAAAKLSGRVESRLIDQFDATLAARQRAQSAKAAMAADLAKKQEAQKQKLAQADALAAQAGEEDQDKLRQAAELQIAVAVERANQAYDRAVGYFEQGDFDKAQAAFGNLKEWIAKQDAVQSPLKASIGAQRTAAVNDYLARIPVEKANLALAEKLVAERKTMEAAQAEADRKYRDAMKLYDDAVRDYNRGNLDKAEAGFNNLLASKVDLGSVAGDAKTYLDRIAAARQKKQVAYDKAAASLATAEKMLADNNWRGAEPILDNLNKSKSDMTDQQVVKLADLTSKTAAARKAAEDALAEEKDRATLKGETISRAQEYLETVREQQKILREQRELTAKEYLGIARSEFEAAKFNDALADVTKALEYQPDNKEAQSLKLQTEAMLNKPEAVNQMYFDITSEQIKARLDQVRGQMNVAIERGRIALDGGRYDDAVKQFNQALEALDFLRQYYKVATVEAELNALAERARAGQKAEEERIKQSKLIAGMKMSNDIADEERQQRQDKIVALAKEATDEYAKGNYQSCMDLCDMIIGLDPNNTIAQDLRVQAKESLDDKAWRAIFDTDKQNRQDERLKLREKLIWPAATIQYPAAEVWKKISSRTGVELPTATAALTPMDLKLQDLLDTNMVAVTLLGVSVGEAVDAIKPMLPDPNVNIIVDSWLDENGVAPLINIDMKNVTLRTIFNNMLHPHGLDYVITDGAIFISTIERCLLREASPENLSLRCYDVQDLLVAIGGTTGMGTAAAGVVVAPQDLINLISMFTGPINWDVLGSSGGGSGLNTNLNNSSNSNSNTIQPFGNPNPTNPQSFMQNFSNQTQNNQGNQGNQINLTQVGAGRAIWYRNGYLMVSHVDRMHKQIEEFMSILRNQSTIQVSVEARLITFTDNFFKDIGIDWTNITFNTGRLGPAHGIRIPAASWQFGLVPDANVAPSVNASAMTLGAHFLGHGDAAAVIHAVKSSRHATVVSAPHVTAINGQQHTVTFNVLGTYVSGYNVIGNIAIPVIGTYQRSSATMTVRPIVSADRRYVTMELAVSITAGDLIETQTAITVSGGGSVAGNDVVVPIGQIVTTAADITTTCRVPDRGTLILSGLSTLSETTGAASVPILSSIPILKRLAVRSAVDKARNHEIYMVTPTIILPEEVEP